MKIITVVWVVIFIQYLPAVAQNKTENLVVVTLDGMRWQEVFGGADEALLLNKKYTRDSADTWKKFWVIDKTARRKKA